MATKTAQAGYPVNSLGEIVLMAGVGNTTVVGYSNQADISLDDATNRMVAVGFPASATIPVPAAITASRSLAAADNGGTLYNATTNAYTLTVPSGLPIGFGVAVAQNSTGVVTVAAGSGVTVNNISNYTKTGGQWAVISIVQTSPNVYVLAGSGSV